MNAQEALAYIEPRLKEWCDYRESHSDVWHDNKNAQDYEALFAIKQLIDQSNAKPKTLEELGWYQLEGGNGWAMYCVQRSFGDIRIFINKHEISFDFDCDMPLTYEEILAIAEKMKELGMTGE